MKILNFTPHTVRIQLLNAGQIQILEFKSSGIARVTSDHLYHGEVLGIPLHTIKYGTVTGLPDPEPETLLIVSAIVLDALPDRKDLVAPASGHKDVVRVDGQIYSVPAFICKGN
jgi:hypothetical protein